MSSKKFQEQLSKEMYEFSKNVLSPKVSEVEEEVQRFVIDLAEKYSLPVNDVIRAYEEYNMDLARAILQNTRDNVEKLISTLQEEEEKMSNEGQN